MYYSDKEKDEYRERMRRKYNPTSSERYDDHEKFKKEQAREDYNRELDYRASQWED